MGNHQETIIAYENIKSLITNQGLIATGGRRPKKENLQEISDAVIAVNLGQIVFVGTRAEFNQSPLKPKSLSYDCKGAYVLPGLVDSHTHLLYMGKRASEWARILNGESYQSVYQGGGGILSTMKKTRDSKLSERLFHVRERLDHVLSLGVTSVEIKTSYALGAQDLEDYVALRHNPYPSPETVITFMALHALPPEFKTYDAYFSFVTTELLPKLPKDAIVDIFVDEGFFTMEHLRKLSELWPTRQLKVHGEEFKDLGVCGFAADNNFLSVDHCLKISDASIKSLSKSSTVACLLPGAALFLREGFAPARKMVDEGVILALGSDHNPGTSPMLNLWNLLSISCSQMKLSVYEAFAAATYNGAQSLNLHHKKGVLKEGFDSDFALFDYPLEEIFYGFGEIKPREVFTKLYHLGD